MRGGEREREVLHKYMVIVFLICREYWRDRDEVNFRKLEFWTNLGERKREK